MTQSNLPGLRPWHDERDMGDAPPELSHEAALAWASGYNAAVRNCTDEQNRLLAEALDSGETPTTSDKGSVT